MKATSCVICQEPLDGGKCRIHGDKRIQKILRSNKPKSKDREQRVSDLEQMIDASLRNPGATGGQLPFHGDMFAFPFSAMRWHLLFIAGTVVAAIVLLSLGFSGDSTALRAIGAGIYMVGLVWVIPMMSRARKHNWNRAKANWMPRDGANES